jgi:hypothetical protein
LSVKSAGLTSHKAFFVFTQFEKIRHSALADLIFLLLLVIHVGAIVGWMGTALVLVSVILPAVSKLSPQSRSEFIVNAVPRLARVVTATSITAIGAGILLFGYVTSKGYAINTLSFDFLVAGAVLGFLAFVVAMGVVLPSSNKLVSILRSQRAVPVGDSASTSVANIQSAIRAAASTVAVLLVIVLVMMIVAANL